MAKSPPLLVIRYHLQVSTAKRYMGCTSKPQALPYSTDTHWSPFPIFFFFLLAVLGSLQLGPAVLHCTFPTRRLAGHGQNPQLDWVWLA